MMLCKLVSCSSESEKHYVLCLSEDSASPIVKLIKDAGIEIFFVKPTRISEMFKILKNTLPHVIQGWMYHGNLFSLFIYLMSNKQTAIVWNIRRSLYALCTEKWTTRLVIKLNSILSFFPNKIIYNSINSQVQHNCIGFDRSKAVLIPNGFDLSLFSPNSRYRKSVRKQLGFSDSEIVIGLVCRYHPKKGHAQFLMAAHMLIQKYSNTRFVLVGAGVDSSNIVINNLLNKLGIVDFVTMLGCRDDVHVIINSFDVATSASLDEAFSNTLGEAMATAIPCVATDVGESKILLDKYGFIVKPNSAASLYEGWCKVIEMDANERMIMAHSGREHIKNLYSLDHVSSLYSKLYSDLK